MHKPFEGCSIKAYPEGSMTQGFAKNPALYRLWGLAGHNGIDLVAPHGTPLFAVEDALVVDVNYSPDGFGKYVRLIARASDGTYREWTYGHLSAVHVVEGKEVKAGDTIGLMGNTGFVVSGATPFWEHNPYAGTHLHLGLRILEEDAAGWRYGSFMPKIRVLEVDNGYKGAIDPAPYFTDTDDKRQKMLTIISILNTIIGLQKKLIERKATV